MPAPTDISVVTLRTTFSPCKPHSQSRDGFISLLRDGEAHHQVARLLTPVAGPVFWFARTITRLRMPW
jgi:hypothetical protein